MAPNPRRHQQMLDSRLDLRLDTNSICNITMALQGWGHLTTEIPKRSKKQRVCKYTWLYDKWMAKTGESKAAREGQSAWDEWTDPAASQAAGLSHVSLLQVSLYSGHAGKPAHNSMETTAYAQVSFKTTHKSGESFVMPSPVVWEGSVYESTVSRPRTHAQSLSYR